jgi:chromosomal replication initiator protein
MGTFCRDQISGYFNKKADHEDKLSRDGIVLPDDMLDFLAAEAKTNVRELIGIINSVIAYSTIYKQDLSLNFIEGNH